MIQKSGRAGVHLATMLVLLSLPACEIPTSVPRWDTSWALPLEPIELAAESLLPPQISLGRNGDLFVLATPAVSTDGTLSGFCNACSSFGGVTEPKPAFEGALETRVGLPTDLVSASVAGGELIVNLYHDFGFDPIRPGAGAHGSITLLLLSAGDTLATEVIDGEFDDLPTGTMRSVRLSYQNAQLGSSLVLRAVIDSPRGDPTHIDGSRRFRMTTSPGRMDISEAVVRMQDLMVDFSETELDLVGGEAMVNRIRGGALRIEIDNPFQISGSFQIRLAGLDRTLQRDLPLAPGHSVERAEFSGHELRSTLDEEESTLLSASAMTSAVGGMVTIRPGQIVRVKSRFELTIANMED